VNLDHILDLAINKFHIVLGTACQAAILFFHFHTGHDIGVGVQNTVYAFYTFLGAHAFTYQKYPDTDTPEPANPNLIK
jgi:hypothetical protein